MQDEMTPLPGGGRVYDADAVDRYIAHLERQLVAATCAPVVDDAADDHRGGRRAAGGAEGSQPLEDARREAQETLADARREIGQLLGDLGDAVELVLRHIAGRREP